MEESSQAGRVLGSREEFLNVGGKWAALMPEEEWASGAPPMVNDTEMFVAVKTYTGRILTGTLRAFTRSRERIASMPKYGPIVAWLPFGEPDLESLIGGNHGRGSSHCI